MITLSVAFSTTSKSQKNKLKRPNENAGSFGEKKGVSWLAGANAFIRRAKFRIHNVFVNRSMIRCTRTSMSTRSTGSCTSALISCCRDRISRLLQVIGQLLNSVLVVGLYRSTQIFNQGLHLDFS